MPVKCYRKTDKKQRRYTTCKDEATGNQLRGGKKPAKKAPAKKAPAKRAPARRANPPAPAVTSNRMSGRARAAPQRYGR